MPGEFLNRGSTLSLPQCDLFTVARKFSPNFFSQKYNFEKFNFFVYICLNLKFRIMAEHVEEKEELNREQVLAWYDEQIELADKRATLAKLQAEAVQYEAQRVQAAIMIAQMRTSQEQQPENPEGDE
jgi:hypothetical protein